MKKKKTPSYPTKPTQVSEEQSYKTHEEWDRAFHKAVRLYRQELNKRTINADEQLDLGSTMLERRKDAVLDHMEDIYQRYQSLLPPFSDVNTLGNEWIWLNLSSRSYSELEAESHLLYGASLWILDHTADNKAYRRLTELLTQDLSELDDLDSPLVWDCQHHELLILGVLHLIYERNSDLEGAETNSAGLRKVLTNSFDASNDHGQSNNRDKFLTLLSLIPEEDVSLAVSHFRELFWEWVERYYRCFMALERQIRIHIERSDELNQQFSFIEDSFNKSMEKLRALTKKPEKENNPTQIHSVLQPNKSNIIPFPSFTPSNSHKILDLERYATTIKPSDYAHQMKVVAKEMMDEADLIGDLKRKQQSLIHLFIDYGRPSKYIVEEEYGQEVAEEINDLDIGDPFELCFALLYLIESGDDLPWLYGPGIGLMTEVAESLPWGISPYNETEDFFHTGKSHIQGTTEHDNIPVWYERKYRSISHEVDECPLNLAQIVYKYTGCLLPRSIHIYDKVLAELVDYGIPENTASWLLYCMLALSSFKLQSIPQNLVSEIIKMADLQDNSAEETENSISYDDLTKKVSQQKKELRSLRSALHEAERKTKTANKEIERLGEELQSELRELANLREWAFQQNADRKEEEEAENDESLPYKVQRNTLVFGGEANWRKAIKQMLTGNIRFLDKDKGFDSTIIRHAEMVWIQTNGLPHSKFYAIINSAKQFKKPFFYFYYPGAVKCANQLRQIDQEEQNQ